MTLITSVSGIRGTIGGLPGESLSPLDLVKFVSGFATWINTNGKGQKVVIGRDARSTGAMISSICAETLLAMGLEVLDTGLTTTPTIAMEIAYQQAAGGIMITASHNPVEWNALKMFNTEGEFVNIKQGQEIVQLSNEQSFKYAPWDRLGHIHHITGSIERHIQSILKIPYILCEKIKAKKYKIAVDCINSTGAISVLPLLESLNAEVLPLNDDMSGKFAHNPEPLEKHLNDLIKTVRSNACDFGIAVDPDVDRLVIIDENGNMFGEEYTLVAVSDYLLSVKPGNTVSNLSSTRALKDITEQLGFHHYYSAVGEVHVVEKMKEVQAVIGGEGNGGVILPDLHYGRDALIGIALFMSLIARDNIKVSKLKQKYPHYVMEKQKFVIPAGTDLENLLHAISQKYINETITTIDGLKIDFQHGWVHLRKSNTEPIVRLYAEAKTSQILQEYLDKLTSDIHLITQNNH